MNRTLRSLLCALALLAILVLSPRPGGATLAAGDCARFVADLNLPDNTVVTTNQVLSKGWGIANCGSRAWSGYRARKVSGFGPDTFPIPATGPGGVFDQSNARISRPISPPPATDARGAGGTPSLSWLMKSPPPEAAGDGWLGFS